MLDLIVINIFKMHLASILACFVLPYFICTCFWMTLYLSIHVFVDILFQYTLCDKRHSILHLIKFVIDNFYLFIYSLDNLASGDMK